MTVATIIGIDACSPQKAMSPDATADDYHSFKAPLYWSVYERCWLMERQGIPGSEMEIPAEEWNSILSWLDHDMKPYGYDMVCTDGFMPMIADDGLYMTRYGSMPLADLVAKCRQHGLKLGVYDNPMWIHCPDSLVIPGTDGITVGSLRYSPSDSVMNPDVDHDWWFQWAVATHPGMKEYIDGFFKHYHDLGIDFIRIDFLGWYEDGIDRGFNAHVGRGYGRECYRAALQMIAESARKYGTFVSLVMPHLYDDAAIEREFGHMYRIVADTWTGGVGHYSNNCRGTVFSNWPSSMNQFDGFIHWSQFSGRGKAILDGDFTRLNTFTTDEQKQSVISLQLVAGGPVAIADQFHNIADNARFYQNRELLALNADRFVGKPLSVDPNDVRSQTWFGQLSDGDYIVALFNRDSTFVHRSLRFSELGLHGSYKLRDLWRHADEGVADSVAVSLKPYACKVLRLTK